MHTEGLCIYMKFSILFSKGLNLVCNLPYLDIMLLITGIILLKDPWEYELVLADTRLKAIVKKVFSLKWCFIIFFIEFKTIICSKKNKNILGKNILLRV